MNNVQMRTLLVDALRGDDGADGFTSPVKSLAAAWKLLYELPDTSPVTVRLAKGEYPVWSNLALYGEGMKNKPASLTIEGDGAVIHGKRDVPGSLFVPVEGKPYYMYQMEMAGKSYPHIRQIYVNGKMQTVAYHGYLRAYDARQMGTSQYLVPYPFDGVDKVDGVPGDRALCERDGYKLYLPYDAVEPLLDAEDVSRVEFHMSIAWYYRVLHLLKVDRDDVKEGNVAVYFKPEEMRRWSAQHGFANHYFFLQNHLAFLDKPGTHYYDKENGILYYYPAEGVDMATATVSIPVTEHMISLFNLENVTLRGLTFTANENRVFENEPYFGGQAHTAEGAYGHNSKSAVFVRNAKNYTVEQCVFREIATTCVRFSGVVQNLSVTDNRFYNVGMSAVDIGEHSRIWGDNNGYYAKLENISVQRNLIDGVAFLTRGAIAIYLCKGKEIEIAYNTVRNTSYTCISVGWRWTCADWKLGENWNLYHADIHHNYFTDFMTGQADGGTIYTLGGNVETDYREHFNFLHDNFVWYSDKCWDGKGIIMPYYHDGASSNWHTHHNAQILYPHRGVLAPIYLQNIRSQLAHNILVEDNDIVLPFGDSACYASGSNQWETDPEYKSNKDFDELTLERKIFGPNWSRKMEDGTCETRVDATRGLFQKNTVLYDNPNELPANVIARSASCGAPGEHPDMEAIIAQMQKVYDAYYAEKKQ